MERRLAAIVLAAGLGTRMRSARVKVLHELDGVPLVVLTLRPLATLDPAPLVLVLGHQADLVRAAVARSDPPIEPRIAIQEHQRGTGDAARCGLQELPPRFDGDVLIAYGDMPRLRAGTLQRFVDHHRKNPQSLSFISARVEDAGGYGRVLRDRSGAVSGIIEARDASPAELSINEINTGIYLADAKFLRAALAELRPDNAQHEFYLTDIVAIARARGCAVEGWLAESAAEFAGVNSREELAQMEQRMREETNRRLMAAGVTLLDPATAYIGAEVEIAADVTIGPNVQILGSSKIGGGVVIEGTAWLRDVTVGPRSHLKIGVRAEACIIGEACEIGPFANLREGTYLAGHNRIGNFVETKKARIGRGAKASHLSYLGDAVIGEETNVGCGVITVNYDGYDKHPTKIGDRCMVGCDTQLIAPVTIGDDVYVASGATIVRDVPDGALVVSDHPQREKPGWTARWHARHANHPKARGHDHEGD